MEYNESIFDYSKIIDCLIYKCDLITTEFINNSVDINMFRTSSMSITAILDIANDLGIYLK